MSTYQQQMPYQQQSQQQQQQGQQPQQQHPNMIQIQAPCSMEAGYSFMANYGGNVFPVTVPPGGVVEGQTITVPYPPPTTSTSGPSDAESAPFLSGSNGGGGMMQQQQQQQQYHKQHVVFGGGGGGGNDGGGGGGTAGQWKDSLFDCFRFGFFHPSVLNSLCPQIMMGQVLTRMKMSWMGESAPEYVWRKTFRRVMTVFVAYWILHTLLYPPSSHYERDPETNKLVLIPPVHEASKFQMRLFKGLDWAFALYTIYVLTKLRYEVRHRDGIPMNRRGVLYNHVSRNPLVEDFCISVLCPWCSVAQMARQTADYNNDEAVCCAKNGLASGSGYDDVDGGDMNDGRNDFAGDVGRGLYGAGRNIAGAIRGGFSDTGPFSVMTSHLSSARGAGDPRAPSELNV